MDKHDVMVAAIGVAAGVVVGVGTTVLVQHIKIKKAEKNLEKAISSSLNSLSQISAGENQ